MILVLHNWPVTIDVSEENTYEKPHVIFLKKNGGLKSMTLTATALCPITILGTIEVRLQFAIKHKNLYSCETKVWLENLPVPFY